MRIKISLRQSDRGDLEWFQRNLVPHPYEDLTEEEAKAYKLLDGIALHHCPRISSNIIHSLYEINQSHIRIIFI